MISASFVFVGFCFFVDFHYLVKVIFLESFILLGFTLGTLSPTFDAMT